MAEPFKFPTAEEITRDWGERCADFDQDCGCCQMWNTYDLIAGQDAELKRLRGALADVINPLGNLKRLAEQKGTSLNANAYSIANSLSFVQSIARDALNGGSDAP